MLFDQAAPEAAGLNLDNGEEEGDGFWNFNVDYGQVPLDKDGRVSSGNLLSAGLPSSEKVEEAEEAANNGGITKTTHMADFYYRKGMSHDRLSELK